MIDTIEIGAGSYPEPSEVEEKTIKLICSTESFIDVPKDWNYDRIMDYINSLSYSELLSDIDNVNIEDIEE